MRILLDTNVVLDVLLKREPFYAMGKELLHLARYAEIEECVSASAVTDIYYVAQRTKPFASCKPKGCFFMLKMTEKY